MNLLVCFALKEEAAPFRKIAAGTAAAAQAASILITGIGRQNAENPCANFSPAILVGRASREPLSRRSSQPGPARQ